NTWAWGGVSEDGATKPVLRAVGEGVVRAEHDTLGPFFWWASPGPDGRSPRLLFTENETNTEAVLGVPNPSPYVKDAFHARVIGGNPGPVDTAMAGTKCAAWYRITIPAGGEQVLRLRLAAEEGAPRDPLGVPDFDGLVDRRRRETDEFYDARIP